MPRTNESLQDRPLASEPTWSVDEPALDPTIRGKPASKAPPPEQGGQDATMDSQRQPGSGATAQARPSGQGHPGAQHPTPRHMAETRPDSKTPAKFWDDTLTAGAKLGKYTIRRLLGKGGMGAVYEAMDNVLGRKVAIKILPREFSADETALKRFIREARLAARLNHPNVVGVHDVSKFGDAYFIVMELISGAKDLLNSKLDWREATRVIADACRALAAAHEQGLVHRDVKPDNILIAGDSGVVKLSDFGLSKNTRKGNLDLTEKGALLGTPRYMSPEQCKGEDADARSDVYSLGATYYTLLARQPPYTAASLVEVMHSHIAAPVPEVRDINPEIPQACSDIIRKAMAKDPADRYPSAKLMLADLDEAKSASVSDQAMDMFNVLQAADPTRNPAVKADGSAAGQGDVFDMLAKAPGLEAGRDQDRQRWIIGGVAAAAVAGLLGLGWMMLGGDGDSQPKGPGGADATANPTALAAAGTGAETAAPRSTIKEPSPDTDETGDGKASGGPRLGQGPLAELARQRAAWRAKQLAEGKGAEAEDPATQPIDTPQSEPKLEPKPEPKPAEPKPAEPAPLSPKVVEAPADPKPEPKPDTGQFKEAEPSSEEPPKFVIAPLPPKFANDPIVRQYTQAKDWAVRAHKAKSPAAITKAAQALILWHDAFSCVHNPQREQHAVLAAEAVRYADILSPGISTRPRVPVQPNAYGPAVPPKEYLPNNPNDQGQGKEPPGKDPKNRPQPPSGPQRKPR